jgi:diadenosine tetraphosphatase ApaH/serine/threonine PP2A family protein phosphatase
MRFAVISDIHSNMEALTAVLRDIEGQHVDQTLCLGDIVGYGASPNECVGMVREVTSRTVIGNHDHAAIGRTSVEWFNPYARRAAEWTRDVLSLEAAAWLGQLPLTDAVEGIRLAHATPLDPEEWRYVLSPIEAAAELLSVEENVCMIGHSHLPGVFERHGETSRLRGFGPLPLDGAGRYLINVGSVGQPRDGNPDAAYTVLDTYERTAELRRVAYDRSAAQKKILDAGLPRILADRLERGE